MHIINRIYFSLLDDSVRKFVLSLYFVDNKSILTLYDLYQKLINSFMQKDITGEAVQPIERCGYKN